MGRARGSQDHSDSDYDVTQQWARAIFATGRFDGIWYEARKGGDFGVALFDTAEAKLTAQPEGDILTPPWVYKLFDVSREHDFVIEPFNYQVEAIHRLVTLGITRP